MENIDLRNKYIDDILNLICFNSKSIESIKSSRKQISYLLNMEESSLEMPIQFLLKNIPEIDVNINSTDDITEYINKFMTYLNTIPEDTFFDGGYSLLISYYFHLTSKLIKKHNII